MVIVSAVCKQMNTAFRPQYTQLLARYNVDGFLKTFSQQTPLAHPRGQPVGCLLVSFVNSVFHVRSECVMFMLHAITCYTWMIQRDWSLIGHHK